MGVPVSDKNVGENPVKKWPLSSERRWIAWIRFLRALFYIIFRIMERIFDLQEVCTLRADLYQTHSCCNGDFVQDFECKNCLKDELLGWNQRPDYPGAGASYNYSSKKERNQTLVLCSMLEAFGLHVARIVLNDPEPQRTARECREAIRKILSRAKASVRFREVFREMIEYLEILNLSSNATLMLFLKARANIIMKRKNIVLLDFLHTHCGFFQCLQIATNRLSPVIHSLWRKELVLNPTLVILPGKSKQGRSVRHYHCLGSLLLTSVRHHSTAN